MIYRVRYEAGDEDPDARLEVGELVADTPAGAAALWRFLAAIDLVATVRAAQRPPDDPLPLMAADPDRVRVTRREGAMWLRLLDVPVRARRARLRRGRRAHARRARRAPARERGRVAARAGALRAHGRPA